MFCDGEICLIYMYYDRFIVGGVVFVGGYLVLDKIVEICIVSFLEWCEMGIVNIGDIGCVQVVGQDWDMVYGDVLYLGMGVGLVMFFGVGWFYIILCLVYCVLLLWLVIVVDVKEMKIGVIEILNKCIICQFIYLLVMESCQFVLGYIMFEDGLVWNIMFVYVYDWCMEVYLYYGMQL